MVIANPTNLGFPAACNQGLVAARGDHLVLLNNDVIVTEGWLDRLIALADSSPDIGLVGPMSNYVTPPQLVADVSYHDLDSMHEFALRWGTDHRGQWFYASKLSGFCLLIKRKVWETIGGLDERFGLGIFDDDDYSLRARKAGFKLAVAHDCFVHHFGSRTFAALGTDTDALLAENHAKFVAKWGADALAGHRTVSLSPWTGVPASPPPTPRPRISLTMIVRDEHDNLPDCLASASGLFDEVVVLDTGSADRTLEIAREHGARVFEFPWINDFAAARNAALSHATGDYAFWLDADDRIEPAERDRLRTLFDGLRPGDEAAYVVRCACDPDETGAGRTVVDHVRLFPLRADLRWEYAVHEQILPAVRRAGLTVRWTDATIRHTGYTDPAIRARKLARDEAILRGELDRRPEDPFTLFNLGFVGVEREDWESALDHLARSLARSAPSDSITPKIHALMARCHQALGRPDEAIRACITGREAAPDDAELLFREAVVRRRSGDPLGAEACWRRILRIRRPERFASLDPGIYGHLTCRNLAALAAERGDPDEERRQWEAVLADCPGDPDACRAMTRLHQPVNARPPD